MADIITRLLLKTNDFDAKLNRAKGSVNGFQSGISNMAKTAGAGIMKFAGAIGVAVGAYEGFNKLMSSSQTLGDEYNRTIDGLKGGVDEFFYSLGSGDWTPFFNGLDETIRKAREAYTAMDQLGNTKMSYGYFNMKNQAGLQEQIAVLRDKNSTEAQKQAARQIVKDLLKDQKEITEQLKRRSTEAMQALVAQGTGLNAPDISLMSIDRMIKFDVSAMGDQDKARLAKKYKDYQVEAEKLRQKYTEIEMVQVGGGMNKSMIPHENVDYEKYNQAMAPVLAKYQDAIMYNTILVKHSDEWLQNLMNIGAEAFNAERAYAAMVKSANRASQSTTGGSGKPTPPPPVGSFAALDTEIAAQNKKLSEATTMQARAAVQATINELEQKKITLKMAVEKEAFEVKHGPMKDKELSFSTSSNTPVVGDYQTQQAMLNWYNQSIEAKKVELSNVVDADARLSIQMQINKLERLLTEYREMINKAESMSGGSIYSVFRNNSGNKKQSSFDLRRELPNMKLPKYESVVKQADINRNNEFADSFGNISNAIGVMSGMFDNSTGSVLQWGASLLTTIGQAIPMILAMIPAKEADTIATNANTTAEIANAGSKVLSAHAGIPFAGIAMGIAGIAAIVGAMASLPTFETGGIIPGTSFSGDRVLARVNSGEMILNSEQQSNLFKILNGKMYGGLNIGRPGIQPQTGNIAALIASGDNVRDIRVSGDVKVRGADLYLALGNYKKKTKR